MLDTTELLVCEQCGVPLTNTATETGCLNCLLLGGLSESPNETDTDRRFQHYELCLRPDGVTLHELGRGAMGITYLAADVNLGSHVALKLINARYSSQDEARERFRREARAAAQLRHPNVASVFHFGETPSGQCFYAMELVEGETLETKVRRDGPLPVSAVLEIATQVTRALVAAEGQGLVHRDLKPSNVMLTSSEDCLSVKVIDFGLAKVAAENPSGDGRQFSGTPGFASPEQFALTSDRLDARSDIYSLGALLWYLLTGEIFAERAKRADVGIPRCVTGLLHSMLAARPNDRPQDARSLRGRLQQCRQALAARARRSKRRRLIVIALPLLALGLFGLTSYLSHRQAATTAEPPEKSIAVLPFENLSDDKENAYFAGAMQDEILSDLAQIADLKVISRTSVMRYQSGTPRNLREIAQSLGVANIVEGSVQRDGPRVRVVAQLIDARTDTHRWSKTYDRELADIFAIQDEISQQIAHELQAKIAPQEKALIVEKPTSDLTAYAFYERARALDIMDWRDRQKCVVLLEEAVRRDPKFFLAQCRLAEAYVRVYAWQDMDSEDERVKSAARAREAIETALRLRPDRGEAHLANAQYFFMTFQGREARRELEIVSRLMPNDSEARFLEARLDRRENRWDEAVIRARRAAELDPHNEFFVMWTADTYLSLRRYRDGEEFVGEFKMRNPAGAKLFDSELARFKLAQGNPAEAQALSRYPTDQTGLEAQFTAAFFAKDYPAALRIIAEAPPYLVEQAFCLRSPESSAEAAVFRAQGEREKAQRIFQKLRQSMDDGSANTPRNEWYFANCSQFDAALGQTDEAIREAQKAVEMHPIAQDPINGTTMVLHLAKAYTAAGDRDRALEQLEMLAKIPSDINYGELRFSPAWDSLRGEPRFEQLIASLEPK